MSYYYPYQYIYIPKRDYETLPINLTIRSLSEEDSARHCFELHNHDVMELNAVVRGKLRIVQNDKEYLLSPGEVLLSNPYALHSGEWAEDCAEGEYLTLSVQLPKLLIFGDSPLEGCLNELMEGRHFFDEYYPVGNPLYGCIEAIRRRYYDKSAANDSLCLGQVYTLLGILLESHYHAATGKAFRRNSDFLRNVGAFISKNYMNPITTQEAAAAVYMEMSQFCRTFRRHYGESFTNHLCRYRIMRAAELYKNSTDTLTVIAKSVGFSDYGYFSRSFKRYIGVTPVYYFGKWKQASKED